MISEASFGFNAMQAGVLPRYEKSQLGTRQGVAHVCVPSCGRLFVSILDEMNLRVWYPHRKFLPSSTNFHYRKTVRELNSIVLQIVQTRRAENEARGDKPITDRTPDLLGMHSHARQACGGGQYNVLTCHCVRAVRPVAVIAGCGCRRTPRHGGYRHG